MPEKSIADKLMIKPGQSLLVVNAPKGFVEENLGKLPEKARVVENRVKGEVDVIQVFVDSQKAAEDQLSRLKNQLKKPDGKLWVTYPKGTSGMKADVNRDTTRKFAPSIGLEAIAIFSMDENWSALRLKHTD